MCVVVGNHIIYSISERNLNFFQIDWHFTNQICFGINILPRQKWNLWRQQAVFEPMFTLDFLSCIARVCCVEVFEAVESSKWIPPPIIIMQTPPKKWFVLLRVLKKRRELKTRKFSRRRIANKVESAFAERILHANIVITGGKWIWLH